MTEAFLDRFPGVVRSFYVKQMHRAPRRDNIPSRFWRVLTSAGVFSENRRPLRSREIP